MTIEEGGEGQGSWITKAFSRHLAEVGKGWETEK